VMGYVNAGYAICLSVLAIYGAGLMVRHRRLSRVIRSELQNPDVTEGVHVGGRL
jgi:hypothetical protein